MYISIDAYQREDLDGAPSFALTRLVQKLLAKNSLVRKYRHFDFLDPCDVFLTWPKNDLSKNCRARPSVANAVYRLSLELASFSRSPGGGYPSPRVGTMVARPPVGARIKIHDELEWW